MELGPPVPEFPEYIVFLAENKNELNCLFLLGYYNQLSVSQLSNHLDRSTDEVLNYLLELEFRKLVEDITKEDLSEKLIKESEDYLRLTPKGLAFLRRVLPAFADLHQEDTIKQILLFGDEARSNNNQIPEVLQDHELLTIRSLLLSYFNNIVESIAFDEDQIRFEGITSEMENTKKSDQLHELYQIPIYSVEDRKELGKITADFIRQLDQFGKRQQTRNEKVQGFQHMYLFTDFLNNSLVSKKSGNNACE